MTEEERNNALIKAYDLVLKDMAVDRENWEEDAYVSVVNALESRQSELIEIWG